MHKPIDSNHKYAFRDGSMVEPTSVKEANSKDGKDSKIKSVDTAKEPTVRASVDVPPTGVDPHKLSNEKTIFENVSQAKPALCRAIPNTPFVPQFNKKPSSISERTTGTKAKEACSKEGTKDKEPSLSKEDANREVAGKEKKTYEQLDEYESLESSSEKKTIPKGPVPATSPSKWNHPVPGMTAEDLKTFEEQPYDNINFSTTSNLSTAASATKKSATGNATTAISPSGPISVTGGGSVGSTGAAMGAVTGSVTGTTGRKSAASPVLGAPPKSLSTTDTGAKKTSSLPGVVVRMP